MHGIVLLCSSSGASGQQHCTCTVCKTCHLICSKICCIFTYINNSKVYIQFKLARQGQNLRQIGTTKCNCRFIMNMINMYYTVSHEMHDVVINVSQCTCSLSWSEKPILWSNFTFVVGYRMNGHVFERFACQQINC